jgi:hypothetical protein
MALCALAFSAWAQASPGVASPVTGFIFDAQSGAVRPMLGIPGASYLGNVVATGLNTASVAPDGSAALAVQQLGRLVLYTGLRGANPPVAVHIPGAIAGADHFAWAGSSDAAGAAVYSSLTGRAQILTGLAQSPVAAAPIDLSGLPGRVTALAFDGQRLIVGVACNEAGGIYLASASAGIQRIAQAASPSAIGLAGGSLYFADKQAQQIWQVESYGGTPAQVLFAHDSGISSPAGLQVSADGQRLYAANAGSRTLEVYDISSHSPVQSLNLNFTPTRLDRFGDASVFLLNGTGTEPLYVVRDGAPGKAAVYFVPATPGSAHPLKAPIRPS